MDTDQPPMFDDVSLGLAIKPEPQRQSTEGDGMVIGSEQESGIFLPLRFT